MKYTGQKLRVLRKGMGITQEDLGSILGLTGKSISNIELKSDIPAFYLMASAFAAKRLQANNKVRLSKEALEIISEMEQ